MNAGSSDRRALWLLTGLLAGLAVAYVWPHERAYANTADRDKNFALFTVPVGMSAAGINDPMDGIFVLDFLTGRLQGAVMNRQIGKFASLYSRDLSKDFAVDGNTEAHYAVASGYGQMTAQQGITMASGVVYIAELNSGKLNAYVFPWLEQGRGPQPVELFLTDSLLWRRPSNRK